MMRLTLSLALACFLSMGCAGLKKQLEFSDTQSKALVFGYLDIDKSPCNLDWLEYKQLYPAIDKPFYYMRVDNGAFYREDFVAPGAAELSAFGGSGRGFFKAGTQYNLKFPGGNGFRIDQPGRIYFIGSFRVVDKSGLFNTEVYIEKIERPTQLEVLQLVLPNAVGTAWEPIIRDAIRRLGGS
jgi:hypothetical protein